MTVSRQPVHDGSVPVGVVHVEGDLVAAAGGAALGVRRDRGFERLEPVRGVMEVRDRLGELGGVEIGVLVLEFAECGAGAAERVGVGHEVVGDRVLDERVHAVGAVRGLDVCGAVLGADDLEGLLSA